MQLDLVGQAVGLTGPDLDRALMGAIGAGVLDLTADHTEVAFHHPLVREAIDLGIAPIARRGWHRRWAEVLEANVGAIAPALDLRIRERGRSRRW